MAQNQDKYAGKWHIRYWYPSNNHDGEDISEYDATIHQQDDHLMLESVPNEEKSYMFARIVIDDMLATGTWQENTSPTGEFKGAIYSGAFQLLVDPSYNKLSGLWVGNGQENGETKIYSGRWEITRLE